MALPLMALGGAALIAGGLGQAGVFGGGKTRNYGFTKEDIERKIAARGAEIDSFSKELAQMRSQYMAMIPGIQDAAYKRFGGDAAASFGAKGIGVDSGAFASALARAAIPMQADMYGQAFQTGTENLKAVDNSRGNAFSAGLGAVSANTSAPQTTQNPLWGTLGGLGGMAMMAGLQPKGVANVPASGVNYVGPASGDLSGIRSPYPGEFGTPPNIPGNAVKQAYKPDWMY